MGRKTKLTGEVIEKLCKGVSLGLKYEDAAKFAGISKATFFNYKNRAEKAKSGLYLDFLDSLKRAEVEGKAQNLLFIHNKVKDREFTEVKRTFGKIQIDDPKDKTGKKKIWVETEMERTETNKLYHGQWQAAAWILERRFPEEFGRHTVPEEKNRSTMDALNDKIEKARKAYGI